MCQPLSALVFCTPDVREPLLVFAAYFDKKNKENKISTNKLGFIYIKKFFYPRVVSLSWA